MENIDCLCDVCDNKFEEDVCLQDIADKEFDDDDNIVSCTGYKPLASDETCGTCHWYWKDIGDNYCGLKPHIFSVGNPSRPSCREWAKRNRKDT
jgi:hypothetical protein